MTGLIVENLIENHPGIAEGSAVEEYMALVYEAGKRVLMKDNRGDYLKPVPTWEEIMNRLDHFDLAGTFASLGIRIIFDPVEDVSREFSERSKAFSFPICGKTLGNQISALPEKMFSLMKQAVVPIAVKEIDCEVHKTPQEKAQVVLDSLRKLFLGLGSTEAICAVLSKNIMVKLQFATLFDHNLNDRLIGLKWVILGHLSASKEPIDPDQLRKLLDEQKSPAAEFASLVGVLLADINKGDTPISALDEILKEVRIFDYLTVDKNNATIFNPQE